MMPALWTTLNLHGLIIAVVVAAAEIAVLWLLLTRSWRSEGWRCPGHHGENLASRAWVLAAVGGAAFLAGAVAFRPVILGLQAPLQIKVSSWMMANLSTSNHLVLGLPAVMLSGLVQEPVKWLVALAAVWTAGFLRRAPVAPRWVVLYGVAAGAGFGGIEAAYVLSAVSAAAVPMAVPLAERVFALLFHLSVSGLALAAWTRGPRPGLRGLLAVSLVHGAFNYVAVVLMPWSVVAVEAFIAVAALTLAGLFVASARRL